MIAGVPAVLVITGGSPEPRTVLEGLPPLVRVIAADSGLDHAARLGVIADLLVGDLDSVTDSSLAKTVQAFSPDKDKTDLELAMDAAIELRPPQIIVVGGSGGRLDHLLANASLLASPRFSTTPICWLAGGSETHVVHSATEFHGAVGDLLSLIPYGGPAHGVTTHGLRWPLVKATLSPGTTWGVSNEMTDSRAKVEISTGILMAIRTHVGPADLTTV